MSVVGHWKRLPRVAVAAPSLEVLKATLDGILAALIRWRCPCLWQELNGGWVFEVSSNTKHPVAVWFLGPFPSVGGRNELLELVPVWEILWSSPTLGLVEALQLNNRSVWASPCPLWETATFLSLFPISFSWSYLRSPWGSWAELVWCSQAGLLLSSWGGDPLGGRLGNMAVELGEVMTSFPELCLLVLPMGCPQPSSSWAYGQAMSSWGGLFPQKLRQITASSWCWHHHGRFQN